MTVVNVVMLSWVIPVVLIWTSAVFCFGYFTQVEIRDFTKGVITYPEDWSGLIGISLLWPVVLSVLILSTPYWIAKHDRVLRDRSKLSKLAKAEVLKL